MSEAASALSGAAYEGGLVRVADAGLQGMVTLRGDLEAEAIRAAVREASGCDMPGQRAITAEGDAAVAWMAPDEVLILGPHARAGDTCAALEAALQGQHHLAVNVSDARALFTVTGEDAAVREVLAKLAPVDLSPGAFGPGDFRRSRLAQVPGAFWMPQAGVMRVICFRSVAQYVFDLLCTSAAPGSRVGYFEA
ncbi:sarcosine oxidase subunit gamma [Sediminimonas qiaohouensis]|uniref:sarcosine oxidase subunit gamma n=1 Tax=Sediminimonas qiaohouensis TaxID=552061 RepID=UPI0003F7659F|nr:sarcosine oxidase subunit gamma family protein [Sediminimonas qiaohouensis]